MSLAPRLSESAKDRLLSMAATGSYVGRDMEPELNRFGLVFARARHTGGYETHWQLTEAGVAMVAEIKRERDPTSAGPRSS